MSKFKPYQYLPGGSNQQIGFNNAGLPDGVPGSGYDIGSDTFTLHNTNIDFFGDGEVNLHSGFIVGITSDDGISLDCAGDMFLTSDNGMHLRGTPIYMNGSNVYVFSDIDPCPVIFTPPNGEGGRIIDIYTGFTPATAIRMTGETSYDTGQPSVEIWPSIGYGAAIFSMDWHGIITSNGEGANFFAGSLRGGNGVSGGTLSSDTWIQTASGNQWDLGGSDGGPFVVDGGCLNVNVDGNLFRLATCS